MPSTSPIRLVRRMQWVSVTMAGLPNTSPIMRLALFLPTPGSFSNLSKSSGTCPSYSTSIFIHLCMSLALLFPSPQGFTISSISSGDASANAWGDGYLAKRSFTTIFTLASVHWAASLTLTRSFHASSYWRVQSASGYSSASRSSICLALCFLVIYITSLYGDLVYKIINVFPDFFFSIPVQG